MLWQIQLNLTYKLAVSFRSWYLFPLVICIHLCYFIAEVLAAHHHTPPIWHICAVPMSAAGYTSSEFTQYTCACPSTPYDLLSSQLTFQDSMFTVVQVFCQDSMHCHNSLPMLSPFHWSLHWLHRTLPHWPSRLTNTTDSDHDHQPLGSHHRIWVKRELGWMAIPSLGDMNHVAACDHPNS